MDYLEKIFEAVTEDRIRKAAELGDFSSGVTDEEMLEARRWANGQELKSIVDTPGFGIVLEILRSFMEQDYNILSSTIPGKNPDEVLANHAVAYTSSSIYKRFRNEVNLSIEASNSVPQVIKEGYKLTKGIPAGPERV